MRAERPERQRSPILNVGVNQVRCPPKFGQPETREMRPGARHMRRPGMTYFSCGESRKRVWIPQILQKDRREHSPSISVS
jgi:hypothetical protein